MKDEEQIKDYKIDSKKFIVVMKKKEKTAEPVAAAAAPTVTSPEVTSPATSTQTAVESQRPEVPPGASGGVSSTAETSNNEGVIHNMMELGYSRRLVEAALRLSYNNPDVACEYLISERITEDNMDSVEADNLALGGVRDELMDLVDAYDNSRSGGNSGSGNPENEPLAFLRSQPQFNAMRQQIQENPQFLNTVLQQIGVNNPGLLKLISDNQAAFVNMINEPLNNNNNNNNNNNQNAGPVAAAVPERMQEEIPAAGEQQLNLAANDDLLAATLASQLADEDDDAEGVPQQQAGPQEPSQEQGIRVELPNLTESDRAAIGRIREISGFSEIEVIQAYIACGKNEELAINFLFTD